MINSWPLLFVLYIYDLPLCQLYSRPTMYADDTTLTCSTENADALQVRMNSDLSKIPTWLKVNKLTLNVKKTKYMLSRSRPKLELLSDNFTVEVNDIHIERVTVYNSLGVSIDENLLWKTHINEISNKISAGLSIVLKRKSNHTVQN